MIELISIKARAGLFTALVAGNYLIHVNGLMHFLSKLGTERLFVTCFRAPVYMLAIG